MMMTMNTEHQQFAAHRGLHLAAIERPQHAAEPRQRRARHEHADEQPVDAIAQRLDHLAVLDARADQEPDPGAVEHDHLREKDDQADDERDDAVFLDRGVAEHERAAEGRGRSDRNLLRAEQRIKQLLGDDRAADRHQDLLEVLSIDGNDQHTFEDIAEAAADDDRRRQREPEDAEIQRQRIRLRPRGERQKCQRGDISAQRNEGAVAEIEHVHHAEGERQAGGHREDHHAHREAGERQRRESRPGPDEGRGDRSDDQRRQRRQQFRSRPR